MNTVSPVPESNPVGARPPAAQGGSGNEASSASWVKWAVLVWVLGISAFHLGVAVKGRAIYRDIHLGTALEYAKGSINLLKPIVVGFNANGVPTPQELPIWQAVTGLVFKLFGTWFGWANVVSLIFLFSGLYPLFKLGARYLGARAAWWTLLLYLAQPMVALRGGIGGTDGLSLTAAIWFIFLALKLSEAPAILAMLLATIAGALAAVLKMPFFMAAGLGCALCVVSKPADFKRSWLWLGVAAMIIGICFFAWDHYVDGCYHRAELSLVDLRRSGSEAKFWYFGDLSYRFSPRVWLKGGFRALSALFGSFSLVGIAFAALILPGRARLAWGWLLGGIGSTFIFFHIVFVHDYYYLMFAPAVALLCSQVLVHFEAFIERLSGWRRCALIVAALAALALSTVQGIIERHVVLDLDPYYQRMADVIRQNTSAEDKLVLQGGGWGGRLFFLSDRNGLSIWNTELLEDPKTYARLKDLGYTKLVLVNQSPLSAAVENSNTIQPAPRVTYKEVSTPIVQTLPTILQTDDILVKRLR